MGVYYGTTEITNVDWIPGDKDITQAFFGSTEVFTVWATYDGTLPAQYNANGDNLADYRIYGSAGGVGDDSGTAYGYKIGISVKSGNLINQDESKNGDGYLPNTVLTAGGTVQTQSFFVTEYIKIEQNTEYSYFQSIFDASIASIQFYDLSKNVLSSIAQTPRRVVIEYAPTLCTRVTSPQNAEYVRFSVQKSAQQNIFVKGTPPQVYQPYFNATTTIYIGSDPLGEDEYVDYGSGKIYHMSGGVLTPTDPPIPLPQLATCNGTNIVDYAGQSAAVPSRFYAKYRKEGF